MSIKLKQKIKVNIQQIRDAIELNFTSGGNPALYHYYENDHIWKLLSNAIKDSDFIRLCIFNNDYLRIAPVHTFASYYLDKVELSNYEKNSCGRFFKFVFESLGYTKSIRTYRKSLPIQYGKAFKK